MWVYSENPESAFFQPEMVSFNSNSAIAPDGNLTADKIISPVGANGASISQGINISSGATLTGSAFVKYADLDRLEIVLLSSNNTTPYARATINPINGTITTAVAAFNGGTNPSASVVSYGNGWYRFSVTVTYPAVTLAGMRVAAFDSGGALGDGTKGTFVWGMQLEVGSFPTSYIPTSGSTATRTADNASITGSNFSDFYNPSEGTLITNINLPVRILTGARSFALDDGTTAYMIDLTNTTSTFTLEGLENSSYTSIRSISNSTSKIIKQATSFNSTSQTISINGEVTSPSSTSLSISRYKNLRIAGQVNNAAYLNGYIQQLVYYPTALPSNQLITLTK